LRSPSRALEGLQGLELGRLPVNDDLVVIAWSFRRVSSNREAEKILVGSEKGDEMMVHNF
jgi:hypothetical protein